MSADKVYTVQELIEYFKELPQELKVVTHLIESNKFTVIVDSMGKARTIRNSHEDHRLFVVDLPSRQ